MSVDGLPIKASEWILVDSDGQHVLAQVRNYQFTSKLTAMLDMSGGGGNPDAMCMTAAQHSDSAPTLPLRVLRDAAAQSY
jgi:hypothetical protein